MPVLPEVPSMIVPPGLRRPFFSASSIIFTAMRSLIELPGLKVSILAATAAATSFVMRLIRTIGVWPMTSRMDDAILVTVGSRVAVPARRLLCDLQQPDERSAENRFLLGIAEERRVEHEVD